MTPSSLPRSPKAQSFEVPWDPTAKGRPRVTMAGGHAHGYTPAKTRHAEAAIRYLLLEQGASCYPAHAPLRVSLTFRVRRPASAPRRITYPATRPDLDQYVKLALDAASGVLWLDDAQIVHISAQKAFAEAGAAPSIGIEVEQESDSGDRDYFEKVEAIYESMPRS